MFFGTAKNQQKCSDTLERYVHLGVVLSDNGSWTPDIKRRCGRGRQAVSQHRSALRHRNIVFSDLVLLADSLVGSRVSFSDVSLCRLLDQDLRSLDAIRLKTYRVVIHEEPHKGEHVCNDHEVLEMVHRECASVVRRRARLLFLPRLIAHAPEIVRLSIMLAGPGCPWVSTVIEDLNALFSVSKRFDSFDPCNLIDWARLIVSDVRAWRSAWSPISSPPLVLLLPRTYATFVRRVLEALTRYKRIARGLMIPGVLGVALFWVQSAPSAPKHLTRGPKQ